MVSLYDSLYDLYSGLLAITLSLIIHFTLKSPKYTRFVPFDYKDFEPKLR